MLLEPERASAVHPQRLEHGAAAQEALVVGVNRRPVDRERPAPSAWTATSVIARTTASGNGAPIAASSGRALTHDSSISSTGSESQTIPPPTQRWMRPSATANVRIVSARSRSPFGWIRPSAPIEAPRPTGSSAAIRSSAAIFGAPVTEPPGNVASRISVRVASGRNVPSTVETRCVTPARGRSARSSGHRMLPVSQTRARSLRSRSTIITCSAASFAEEIGTPAGRVPLIGAVHTRLPRRARKSSGEADTIAQPSPTSGRGSSGWSGASRSASPRGSPSKSAARCWTRFAW